MDAESALEEVQEKIDEVCEPDGMSRTSYRDFLELLLDDVRVRLELVREELAEELYDHG